MFEEAITGHTILDTRHLDIVLKESKLFGKDNWQKFGLKAGLYHNTLKEIKADHGNVDACFRECAASWLMREDNVDNKGKPTLLRLADILEETGDRAAADEIRETIKKKDEEEKKSNMEYTGMMYHVEKDGYWKTYYTVNKDSENYKKYLKHEHPNAEYDGETIFRFKQPKGTLTLELHMDSPQQTGWTVHPDRKPMTILQSKVDAFPNEPLYSTCSMTVFAEPGVATEPLHCPIKLTGIHVDSEGTIYINRPVPRLPSNNEEWLKEGIVNLTVTRINMHGPPGSGKTCSQLLLLNQDPPAEAVTDSTPIACRAVKVTKAFIHNNCLKKVDGHALFKILASALHKEELFVNHIADTASDPDVKKVCVEIVQAINQQAQKHHLVYIIDSGGQVACQELLPLFTRAVSLNIITLDLSKGINEKIYYQYRIGGKSFNCDLNFTCTNIDFLRTVFSSGAITPAVSSYTTLQRPIYLVLGTHKDIAKQEDIDKLNNELSSLTSSVSEEKGYHLVLPTTRESKKITYPINTLEKGLARQEEAKKLCRTILSISAAVNFSIRIQWVLFEFVLQQKAETKKCDILEMDDVLFAGRSLQMSENDTKEALQFFHNVTVILYYPDVLPNIVFVNPHPILETLTHLLALTYEVDLGSLHHIANETPLLDELTNIATNGIFAESLLSKLKSDDQKFPNSDFIKLLLHLHIIAETADGYFLPCALKFYNGPSPEADLNPLLIVWLDPDTEKTLPVPHGVFPLTIVHLMNHEEPQFCIPPSSNKYFKYRDAMSFRIRLHGDQIGTIHIINKYKHIEVYFDGCKPAKYCPLLFKLITEAVRCSSVAVGARQCHRHAFICSSKNKEKCYCIVTNEEKEKVECTICPKPADIRGQEYWNWFHYTPQSSSEESDPQSDPPRCLDITWLREVRKSLKENHFFESEWNNLGIELGLYASTLSTIDYNNPRDVSGCLRDMLLKWLQGADGVLNKGGSTWASLANALKDIDPAVAEHIRCKWIKRKKSPSTP